LLSVSTCAATAGCSYLFASEGEQFIEVFNKWFMSILGMATASSALGSARNVTVSANTRWGGAG